MFTLRSPRLSAGVAVSLYALTGCALAVSQYLMLAPHPAGLGAGGCAPGGFVAAASESLGVARTVAARVADLRYGPGADARLVPIASEGALQALTQTPPTPVGPPRCGGAVTRI